MSQKVAKMLRKISFGIRRGDARDHDKYTLYFKDPRFKEEVSLSTAADKTTKGGLTSRWEPKSRQAAYKRLKKLWNLNRDPENRTAMKVSMSGVGVLDMKTTYEGARA